MVVPIIIAVGGYTALYAFWPGRGVRSAGRMRAFWAVAGTLGLGGSLAGFIRVLGPSVGCTAWLSVLMVAASLVVTLAPLLRPSSVGAPVSSRRRGTLRHPWSGREGWSKGAAAVAGGFVFFTAVSLWLPVAAVSVGASLDLGLALSTASSVVIWAVVIAATLLASNSRRAWLALLGGSAAMAGHIALSRI